MALAVAMVACESATGAQGDPGDTGAAGAAGPAGPPGTTDNEPPMATMDLPMVYLALKGTGAMPSKTGIDLGKHFADAENAALTYKAESSDKAVATVEVKDGMLSVTGKGAGMATVTVNAYDGVNTDSAMSSFDVKVVASNVAPSVIMVTSGNATPDETNLGSYSALSANLYTETEVTVKMNVYAGVAGDVQDVVTFNAIMGPKKGADDDIVSVKVEPKAGKPGEWVITLTPKKSGRQTVYLLMEDKFGAEVWDGSLQFVAMTNTVPMRDDDLPAAKLYLSGNERDDKDYVLSDYFVLTEEESSGFGETEYVDIDDGMTAEEQYLTKRNTETPDDSTVQDTTCTATVDDSTIATVGDGSSDTGIATLTGSEVSASTASFTVTGVKAGKAGLTIVCRDVQGGDTGTAAITVR
jgi:hypothetical protein